MTNMVRLFIVYIILSVNIILYMSVILGPVRSYANSRSSILDIDPKLVCKDVQKGPYASQLGSNLGLD